MSKKLEIDMLENRKAYYKIQIKKCNLKIKKLKVGK